MVGTRPLSADSDGGGESDASELSGGRDPLDASDDRAFVYMADVVPGNGKVLLRPRVDPDAIELVEVQRAPDPLGPYGLVFSGALPADGIISDEASNDGPACYRMRTVAAEIISGWSPPVCVQPAADPFPPVLAPRAASFVDLLSATAVIELEASAFGSFEHDRTDGLLDPAVRPTPLESVRFSARRDFEDAEWVPFQSSLTVPLAPEETTVLYFQVRDSAGNVSQPRLLAISRNAGEEEPSVPLGLPSAVLLGLVLSVTGSLLARTRRRR
jgi:hypothetical protein